MLTRESFYVLCLVIVLKSIDRHIWCDCLCDKWDCAGVMQLKRNVTRQNIFISAGMFLLDYISLMTFLIIYFLQVKSSIMILSIQTIEENKKFCLQNAILMQRLWHQVVSCLHIRDTITQITQLLLHLIHQNYWHP